MLQDLCIFDNKIPFQMRKYCCNMGVVMNFVESCEKSMDLLKIVGGVLTFVTYCTVILLLPQNTSKYRDEDEPRAYHAVTVIGQQPSSHWCLSREVS